eukprot:scaffold25495_cov121-Isochrysis_galbana.AAC.7
MSRRVQGRGVRNGSCLLWRPRAMMEEEEAGKIDSSRAIAPQPVTSIPSSSASVRARAAARACVRAHRMDPRHPKVATRCALARSASAAYSGCWLGQAAALRAVTGPSRRRPSHTGTLAAYTSQDRDERGRAQTVVAPNDARIPVRSSTTPCMFT